MKTTNLNFTKFLMLAVSVTLVSSQVLAGWFDDPVIDQPFPANLAELSGVYSGKQDVGGKSYDVEVFIHPGAMAGSFIVTLLTEAKTAQIFYAEVLDQKTLGLVALGLVNDQGSLEEKMPPAALLKIIVNSQNRIQTIEISPQDGVKFLTGAVKLTSVSDDFSISNVLAQGEYKNRDYDADLKVISAGEDNILVSGKIEFLGVSNDYSLSFDLTGVGALRSRAYADQFQKREKPGVSALMLPILADGKPAVLVLKTGQGGSSNPAVILKLK